MPLRARLLFILHITSYLTALLIVALILATNNKMIELLLQTADYWLQIIKLVQASFFQRIDKQIKNGSYLKNNLRTYNYRQKLINNIFHSQIFIFFLLCTRFLCNYCA